MEVTTPTLDRQVGIRIGREDAERLEYVQEASGMSQTDAFRAGLELLSGSNPKVIERARAYAVLHGLKTGEVVTKALESLLAKAAPQERGPRSAPAGENKSDLERRLDERDEHLLGEFRKMIDAALAGNRKRQRK